MPHQWLTDTTLSGKANGFQWKINGVGTTYLREKPQTKSGYGEIYREISQTELNAINKYVSGNKWYDLANNAERLREGTESESLCTFLYEKLKWPETDCQLASHLGALFFRSGVWDYNGKKRGIKFKSKRNNKWWQLVALYYKLSKNRNSSSALFGPKVA